MDSRIGAMAVEEYEKTASVIEKESKDSIPLVDRLERRVRLVEPPHLIHCPFGQPE